MASPENERQDEVDNKNQGQQISNFISFFDTIDQILVVIDYDGCFVDINRAGIDILGYTRSEVIGKNAAMIFSENLHKEITLKFKNLREKGSDKWQYTLISKSGLGINAEINFHKGIWNKRDAFYLVVKTISSEELITEARKVSLKILSQEHDGNFKQIVNMAMQETIRLTNSELGFFARFDKAKSLLEDVSWVVNNKNIPVNVLPDTMVLRIDKKWETAIKNKIPVILEQKEIHVFGEGFQALKNGMVVPLISDGEINYFVGLGNRASGFYDLDVNLVSILWDNVITEIKRINTQKNLAESESEYKNLFDSSRDALMLYDLEQGKIILSNDAAVEMFGYKSHSALKKNSPLELSAEFQPDGTRSSEALSRNPFKALHKSVIIPYWIHTRKNGDEFPSEVSLTGINYKGKQIILANVRDISYRVKVEADLRKSEESFNLAVEEGGLGIWDYNVETMQMTVDKGFSKIIGLKSNLKLQNPDQWLNLIHPDDIESVEKNFREHIEGTTERYNNEYRIRKTNGEYVWVQSSGRAVERDKNGIGIRIVGIIYDITSTKELSQEVENTRNFLETIISSIEAILFVKDTSGKYLLVNRSFVDKFGLRSKKVIGKTGEELKIPIEFDSTLTDDLVIKQGVEQIYEQEVRLSDGKMYDYLISKIPIKDKSGEVYAQVGLATDITHIKELEKDLRNNVFSLDAAINGTGSGLWDWNPKADNLILNDNWFSMLGYTRSQFNKKYKSFGFRTLADYVHPEDIPKIEEELEKHYAGKTQYYRIEIRMLTSEHQWKWILASGKVWEWDKDNNPTRMVGIHVDIDYRVRIEEQLKQALVKAEESDRLKSAFLANMSHEIRTPMNGIIGFLDLMEDEDMLKDQRQEYMSIIRNSSNQLLDIVNDIVDISKIEAGQVTIRETSFDLAKLFEDIQMQYRPALEGRGIVLKVNNLLKSNEMSIVSDHTKLRQILSNLVSNSIKFTDKGSIEITCKRDGSNLLFTVSDTGTGIPADLHKRVFERFVQAEIGLSRIQEGTGLGLSICKAFVEKLGGKIWLDSKSGKGSTFFFTLPLNIGEEVIADDRETEDRDDTSDGVILIVEDEIYNYLFVEQILQNRGLRVLHAADGKAALEFVQNNPSIAMVLMDIRLPGMDGYEVTRRIKKDYPDLPVVALTALALTGDREKALEAGCDDYLKKPVLREELLNVVDKVFKG